MKIKYNTDTCIHTYVHTQSDQKKLTNAIYFEARM